MKNNAPPTRLHAVDRRPAPSFRLQTGSDTRDLNELLQAVKTREALLADLQQVPSLWLL